MQAITSKTARVFSRLGQRGTIFGTALPELAQSNENIRILTADLAMLSGLDRFKNAYPDKFINVGIAEQNMIGIAAGLANEGNTVFATTYATFITMRSFEQIRHHLGYQKQNVKIVGATAGFSMGMSGNTHYAIEDIAIMRAIPNMVVVSPADSAEAYKVAYAAVEHRGPMSIRLTGLLNTPRIYTDDYDFILGKAMLLREGKEVTLFACGSMVAPALEAANQLADRGISCAVINMHTIKPLDNEAIIQARNTCLLVSIEEHSTIGGLGGAIAEVASSYKDMPPLLRIGIADSFDKADEYERLLEKHGLTAELIAKRVQQKFESL